MIRFIFRLFSLLFFIAAIIIGILDAANSIISSRFLFTSFTYFLQVVIPSQFSAFQHMLITYLGQNTWQYFLLPIFNYPSWIFLLVLSLICYLIGRRHYKIKKRHMQKKHHK